MDLKSSISTSIILG